jgi:hypothetical protein
MTDKDTALRLALEYVELVPDDRYSAEHIDQDALITAIKAALSGEAQTRSVVKDEPDQYAMDIECTKCGAKQSGVLTVHTTPPPVAEPHKRKPLTDEEIERIWESLPFCNGAWETFARRIEAAHGIKGEA